MSDYSLDYQFSESAATIADATIRIIASRGLDAVSVREVAKESGFAAGSVQYLSLIHISEPTRRS